MKKNGKKLIIALSLKKISNVVSCPIPLGGKESFAKTTLLHIQVFTNSHTYISKYSLSQIIYFQNTNMP